MWMTSLSYATTALLTPLVVALCRRNSTRLLAVIGGLLTSLTLLFTSFSTHGYQLVVCLVAILPIGTSVSTGTSEVILGRYFRKRRECAEMLVLCGSGVGMAVVTVVETHVFRSKRVVKWSKILFILYQPFNCSLLRIMVPPHGLQNRTIN